MVEKQQIYIPCSHDMRTLHIYTPLDYNTCKTRYPVFYMYDGHNLFYDEDATYGTSWGLKDYLDLHHVPLIIIGIECSHEGYKRLEEFSPYDFKDTNIGEIHGQGKQFMNWVTTDLKTWVDRQYRTLPSRKYTGIGGSSMGGLMALYSITHHNDIYSRAACLSPFIFGVKDEIDHEIKQATMANDTRIYISWGSDEFRSKNQLAKASIRLLELTKQLQTHHVDIYPNILFKGRHSEESWREELDVVLPYLFK